jgi:RHS repeat-associated protein
MRSLIVALFLVVMACSTTAQITSTDGKTASGIAPGSPAGSYKLSEFDNINLYNGNLNFVLPLVGVVGRGEAKHQMSLGFNTKGWRVRKTYDTAIEDYEYSPTQNWWAGGGAGLGPGSIIGRKTAFQSTVSSCLRDAAGNPLPWPNYTLTRLTFTMPDGTEHELRDQNTNGQPLLRVNCNTGASRGTIFVSSDGTDMTFISDTTITDYVGLSAQTFFPSGYLMLRSGVRYRIDNGKVTWIRDRNGNRLSFTYDANEALSVITDSLNRQVTIAYNVSEAAPYGLCNKITYSGFGGAPRVVRLSKTSMSNVLRAGFTIQTLQQLFPELNAASTTSTHNPTVISSVWLPDGRRYQFFYNSYGELARVVLPTGGAYEYDMVAGSGVLTFPYNGDDRQIYRRVAERRIYTSGGTGSTYASRMLYSATQSGPNDAAPYYTNVTVDHYNAGSTQVLAREKHYFNGSGVMSMQVDDSRYDQYSAWTEGQEYKTESIDPTGTGTTVLRRVENTFQQRAAVAWWPNAANDAPPNDPRLVQTLTTLADSNQVTKQTYAYSADLHNNQTDVYSYNYGAGAPPTYPTRHTHTDYLSTNVVGGVTYNYQTDNAIHLRSLPTRSKVYAVNPSTGVETLTSDATLAYDQTALTDDPGIVGLDSAFTVIYRPRGNVTRNSRWINTNNTWLNTDMQYDVAGNIIGTTDARGELTQVEYSSIYQYAYPTSIITPIPDTGNNFCSTTSLESSTSYDLSTGLVTSITDANNKVTTFEYNDGLDRLTKVVRPTGGGSTTYTYNDVVGNLWVRTQTAQSATVNIDTYQFFDGLGRPNRSFQYENSITTTPWLTSDTQYDALGRVWRVSNTYRAVNANTAVNPSGDWTTTQYDALGRITSVTTPDNAVVTTSYSGNQVTTTDQAGRKRRSVTDALGRLTQVVEDPDNLAYQTDYIYDALGNLRKVTQGTQLRYFMYDSLSRLIRAKNPEQNVNAALALTDSVTGNASWSMSYSYDANSNLSTKTDARNITATYSYDNINRNTVISYSDGTLLNRTYDSAVNGRGRPRAILYYVASGADSQTATNNYDAVGRPLDQQQYFGANDIWGTPFTVQRAYDLAGHVTSQTYPSGRTVSYTYDRTGRTATFGGTLGDSVSRNYMTAIAFDDSGRMTRERFGTDTLLYHKQHFNVRGQLYDSRISTVNDEDNWNRGAIVNYYSLSNYCFGCSGTDNNGNLYIQQHFVPTDDAISSYSLMQQNYDYDELNRLKWTQEYINGSGNTPGGWQGSTFDRWGNRTLTGSGTGINTKQFSISSATNRLGVPAGQAGVMTYDANGNLTNDTYSGFGQRTFDVENRMLTATGSNGSQNTYTYDGLGQRVRRQLGAQTTWQVYGLDGELLAEYAAGAAATAPQNEYGYRNGEMLVTASSGANVQWMVTDQLGTPRMIADRTGTLGGVKRHDYLPFGEELFAGVGGRTAAQGYVTDTVRQKFTKKERDIETGLDYFGARYYSSPQGRFISPDSITGNQFDPQTLNLYAYVQNNPLKFIDPTGHLIQNASELDPSNTSSAPPCWPDCSLSSGQSPVYNETVTVTADTEPINVDTTIAATTLVLPALAATGEVAAAPSLAIPAAVLTGVVIGDRLIDAFGNPRQPTRFGPGGIGISCTAGNQAQPIPLPIPAPPPGNISDNMTIVRGGVSLPAPRQSFSGSFGLTLYDAASGVRHNQVSFTTVGAIRQGGGSVVFWPEPAYPGGPMNWRHVNVTVGNVSSFIGPVANPVPKTERIPGRP